MERLAVAAHEGRLDWLDEVLHRSGYVRADEGIRQADLVEGVPNLTRETLRRWQQEGLQVRKAGSGRFYDPIATIAWLYSRFVRPGRPREARGEGLAFFEEENLKWQARTRKLNFGRLAEKMLERSEAVSMMTAMVVEARAALQAMAGTLAAQLEHRTHTEIRRALDGQVRFILQQMAEGIVPVPHEVAARVKKIRDEACEAVAAVLDRHFDDLAAEAEEEDAGGRAARSGKRPAAVRVKIPKPSHGNGPSCL